MGGPVNPQTRFRLLVCKSRRDSDLRCAALTDRCRLKTPPKGFTRENLGEALSPVCMVLLIGLCEDER